MVRSSTDRLVDEAIELGKRNQQTYRYLNWCKHLHINLLSRSMVGQRVNLPIGPHEIYCDYYSGGQSVNVELVVSHFIAEHCTDCPYHEEIHTENLGRAIVQKVRERRARLSPALETRQKIQELVQVTDVASIPEQEIHSDRDLLAVLGLLEHEPYKQQAVEKILMVAQELPIDLFGVDAVRVLTTYYADADIGERVIEITRAVCKRQLVFFDIVIGPAQYAFADGHYREALAYLLGDYVNAVRDVENIVELIPTLMAHNTMNLGIPIHQPSEGAIHALRAIANVDLESVLRVIETDLKKGDKESRLEACDSLDFLIEDHPEQADRVFELLLKSLESEESRYERSADIETLVLLARMVSQNLARLSVVEEFYERASVDVKALIFRFYQELAKRTDDEGVQSQCAAKAIHLLAAGIDHIEVLEGCAGLLVRFGRTCPDILAKHLDSLMGALTLVSTRPTEIRELKTSDVLEAMNQIRLAAQWDHVLNEIEKAIEEVGKRLPESVAPVLQRTIVNTSSKTDGALKSRLISALGKIAQEHLTVAQAVMPVFFGILVDVDSIAVRGNTVRAFGDIAMYSGDILPADVVELMKEMLWHESYTYVIMNLVYTFQYIRMPSREFATSVCKALAGLENSIKSPQQKEEIVDALLGVASGFDELRRAVKPWLWRYCHHEEYWIRRGKLEKWFRWCQQYPEYTYGEYLQAALQFYRDLKVPTRDFNGPELPYQDMMDVPRQYFAEHLTAIVDLSKNQDVELEWNKRDFAALLSIKEYYSQSAELYHDVVDSLPLEPRFDELRKYYRALAHRDMAEAYALNGNLDRAIEKLNQAAELVDNETKDLERIQVVLRHTMLRLLREFELTNLDSFIHRIQALRQQYADLFKLHYLEIHENDDHFFHSLAELLECLELVGKWAKASLQAEQDSSRYLEAAQNHLELAIDHANQSDSALYAECLKRLEPMLSVLNRAREVSLLILNAAQIPLPLIFDYRTKDHWGGKKFRQQALNEEGLEGTSAIEAATKPEDVKVAQVNITVDGQAIDGTINLRSGLAYGLTIQFNFARWPEQYAQLQLRFFSTTPAANLLPMLYLDRPAQFDGSLSAQTHLVFDHPLSPSAPPIEAKLVASLVSADGKEHTLDLFGCHDLTLRVLEKPSTPATSISITNSQGIAIGDNSQATVSTARQTRARKAVKKTPSRKWRPRGRKQ